MPKNPFWSSFLWPVLFTLALSDRGFGGEAYYTGFETFVVGNDKIVGTDSWVGTNLGQNLHGVMSEGLHGVVGIGNAGFIGGYATTTSTATSKTVHVRRPVNLDPVALDQEVLTFSAVFGIKDSTSASLIPGSSPARYKRDNFEFVIYNKDASPALLAGLQFDNTTLDTITGKPRRLIYRLSRNAGTGFFEYVATGFSFLPETLETLTIRINYRTNRWTAALSGVPIFQDLPFYSGAAAKTFGFAMIKMAVTNVATTTNYILPGDNYMLFDDCAVRTDAVALANSIRKPAAAAASVTWNQEAGYVYQVQYSSDCQTWKTDLANSSQTAATTESATFTDPTIPVPANRFYRLKGSSP